IEAQRSDDKAVRLISLLRQAEEGPLEAPARDALRALATSDRAPIALLARARSHAGGAGPGSAGGLGRSGTRSGRRQPARAPDGGVSVAGGAAFEQRRSVTATASCGHVRTAR